jgi:hypothetical protein
MTAMTGIGKKLFSACGALALLTLACADQAEAAEGGASHYLPGAIGDFGIAIPPKAGWQIANQVWIQSGDVSRTVQQGQVTAGLDATVVLNLVSAFYTLDVPALGGTFTAGAIIPFGYANVDGSVATTSGSRGRSDESFNLSDIALVPAQLNWVAGDFSFRITEMIFVPSGGYDKSSLANLGRNYWSFDTSVALTWFQQSTGTEVSIAPGVMLNTENPDTDYKTGSEFHVDVTANQFLSQTFAIGPRGYYYRQVGGDSGAGALLGAFKAESIGLGLGFLWTPAAFEGRMAIAAKWIHDFDATHRIGSDYGQITLGYKF